MTTRREEVFTESDNLLSEAAGGDALTGIRNPFADSRKDQRDNHPESVTGHDVNGPRPGPTPRSRSDVTPERQDEVDKREEALLQKIALMIREEKDKAVTSARVQESETPHQDRNVQLEGIRQRRAMNPIVHRINQPYMREPEYQNRWVPDQGIPQIAEQQPYRRAPSEPCPDA